MLAGQYRGPAGLADGVSAEAFAENDPLLGDTVNVRRLVDLRAVRADGLGAVVVGEDEKNIGWLFDGAGGRKCRGCKNEDGWN